MSDRVSGIRRRFSVRTMYGALEIALMALAAYALAALIWASIVPIGAFGDWKGSAVLPPPPRQDFAGLDPLFGFQTSGGPMVVSDSGLELFGLRMDRASGRGSAILATEGEPQQSFDVGEEVAPGVILQAVEADHVVLSRGGAEEVIFLDQSEPATRVASGGSDGVSSPQREEIGADAPGGQGGSAAADLSAAVRFARRAPGEAGVEMQPGGDGNLFRRSGLQGGDVLISIDGNPMNDPGAASTALENLNSDQSVSLIIERQGSRIPVTVRVP